MWMSPVTVPVDRLLWVHEDSESVNEIPEGSAVVTR